MKKVLLCLVSMFLFLLPMGVEAATYKDMISYMKKAIQNRDNWEVGDIETGSYEYVNVKVGKLEGKLKEAWDDAANAYFTLYACVDSARGSCSLDDFNHGKGIGAIQWQATTVKDTLVLKGYYVPKKVYEATTNTGAKFGYAASVKEKVWYQFGPTKKEEGEIVIEGGKANDDAVDKTLGKESNPRVIRNTGSITIPKKDDSFWDGMDNKCVYFRFDWTDIEATGTYARYEISPVDIVQSSMFWGDDLRYALAATPIQDIKDVGYFGIDEKHYYALCTDVTKIYGKKVTFTYKDTKPLNVADQNEQEGNTQVGEENIETPNNPKNEFDKMPASSVDPSVNEALKNGCEIIQTGTTTFKFLKKVINYVKIGTIFLVLVLGMVDLAGAVGSDEENAFKKAGTKFGKRLIAVALVFLVPAIVEILNSLVNDASCEGYDPYENLKDLYN